jgi:bacterioferritin
MRAYAASRVPEMPSPRTGSALTDQLDAALASKIVQSLRSRRHHFMARRRGTLHSVDMFMAHSNAAQAQADALALRIVELQGEPGFTPSTLNRHGDDSFESFYVVDMAREDLEATRKLNRIFHEILLAIGPNDPPTRRLVLGILNKDKLRSKDLSTLMASFGRVS